MYGKVCKTTYERSHMKLCLVHDIWGIIVCLSSLINDWFKAVTDYMFFTKYILASERFSKCNLSIEKERNKESNIKLVLFRVAINLVNDERCYGGGSKPKDIPQVPNDFWTFI